MNLNLPFVLDQANDNKPSVTLLFAYCAFLLAVGVDIALCFKDLVAALLGAIVLFLICVVMYRMRQIDKLKITKDSVEVDADQK